MLVVIIGAIGAIILPTAAPERTPCQEKAQPSRKKTSLSLSCQRSKLVLDRFFTDSVVNRHTNSEMKENIILPNNRDPETDKLFSVHADFFKFCFLFSKRLICKATFMGFWRADFRADHPCRETGCCTSSIHSKDISTFVNQHHSFRKFSPHAPEKHQSHFYRPFFNLHHIQRHSYHLHCIAIWGNLRYNENHVIRPYRFRLIVSDINYNQLDIKCFGA